MRARRGRTCTRGTARRKHADLQPVRGRDRGRRGPAHDTSAAASTARTVRGDTSRCHRREDERKQVDREWRDPQQGDGSNVLADVIGNGEQQERTRRRQGAPKNLTTRARRRFGPGKAGGCGVLGCAATGRWCGRAEAVPTARDAKQHEDRIGNGPAIGLHSGRDPGFKAERIADQCQHRREIRQGEQPVRAASGKLRANQD